MKENTIKAALAAALGALCAYGIQLLVPVLVLLVVMVLDYITGMAKAWHAGELSSRVGLWGILKKVGYLVIVGVACVVDWLLRYGADSLGWNWPVDFLFASIVIIWLVINELLSILENVSAIGAPVPGFMQALLKKLKVHTEDTAEENLPGEENQGATDAAHQQIQRLSAEPCRQCPGAESEVQRGRAGENLHAGTSPRGLRRKQGRSAGRSC